MPLEQKILGKSKIYSSRATIVEDVRNRLHLKDGDEVVFYEDNNRIYLEKNVGKSPLPPIHFNYEKTH